MAALPVDYVRVYSEEGQSGALIEPIVLLTVQRDSHFSQHGSMAPAQYFNARLPLQL